MKHDGARQKFSDTKREMVETLACIFRMRTLCHVRLITTIMIICTIFDLRIHVWLKILSIILVAMISHYMTQHMLSCCKKFVSFGKKNNTENKVTFSFKVPLIIMSKINIIDEVFFEHISLGFFLFLIFRERQAIF